MKRPRTLDVDERETLFWLQVSEAEVKALVHGRVAARVRVALAVMLAAPTLTRRLPAVPIWSER